MNSRLAILAVVFLALMGLAVAMQNLNAQSLSGNGSVSSESPASGNIIFVDDTRFVEKCSLLLPNYTINLSCPTYYKEVPVFLEEAELIAESHEYKMNSYSCGDYSNELANRLKSDGYEAYYCQGTYGNKSMEHAWVKVVVYMEATTGKVIEPRYYEEYNERFCR